MKVYSKIIRTTLSLAVFVSGAVNAFAAPTIPEASTEDLLDARQKIENRREVIGIYKEIRSGIEPKSVEKQKQSITEFAMANAQVANLLYQTRFQIADACRKHFNVGYVNSTGFHLAANQLMKSHNAENEAKVLFHSLIAEDLRARELAGTVGQTGILIKSNPACIQNSAAAAAISVALDTRHKKLQEATLALLGQVGVETLHDLPSRLAQADLDDAIFDRNVFFASLPVSVLLPMGFAKFFPQAVRAINLTLAGAGAVYGGYQGYKISSALSDTNQIFTNDWQKRLDEITELIDKDPSAGELLAVLTPYFQSRATAYTEALEETHNKLLPLLEKYGSIAALEQKTVEHRIKVETELKNRGVSL